MHEKRQQFSDQVQEACRDDLEQNGFKLESVAVTNLDQTPLEALDENNRFDVVAIQTIKQEVEDRQTQTARIEHENQVKREENRLKAELEIKEREEETESQALEVAKRLDFAQEEQRKSIATNKAEQEREIEAHKLEQQQAVEEARIKQEEAVKSTEILQKQRLETARIEQERRVQETEIAQKQAVESRVFSRNKRLRKRKSNAILPLKELRLSRNGLLRRPVLPVELSLLRENGKKKRHKPKMRFRFQSRKNNVRRHWLNF